MESSNANDAAKNLLQKALANVADSSKITVEELKIVPQGKRRRIHDDITVVVIPIQL